MAEIKKPFIKLTEQLSQQDFENVAAMQNLCREADGVFLKLELEFKMSEYKEKTHGIERMDEFLYYSEEKLIGYIGICDFGGESVEISGMTHPDFRRMGVFTKLFSLVSDELRRREGKSVLLLCDRSSEAGRQFVWSTGAAFHHAEHEMSLKAGVPSGMPDNAVTLSRQESEGMEVYVAHAEGVPVGSVRLELINGVGGIYGVEVMPEFRGRGYGKGLLLRAVEKLREKGAGQIRLQVDTDNPRALHIYESSGFTEDYTMDYYLLCLKNRTAPAQTGAVL